MSAAECAQKLNGSAAIDVCERAEASADQSQWASTAVLAATQRRLDLLSGLPLGDLSTRTCLDFGVGQSFGCSFPALRECARGIRLDLSSGPCAVSPSVPGARYTSLSLRGGRIDLQEGSVDLIHADDSIECVENVELLLEEFHRILTPGGLFVLTTAPAEPEARCTETADVACPPQRGSAAEPSRRFLSRVARNPRKAVKYLRQVQSKLGLRTLARHVKRRLPGASVVDSVNGVSEPLGRLSYGDLLRFLAARFEVSRVQGYGGALGEPAPTLPDSTAASAWAAQLVDRPEQACRVVLLARRRDDYRPHGRIVQQRQHHDSPHIHYRGGPWDVVGLRQTMTGRMTTGGEASWLTMPVEGTSLVLHFWSSPWGGEAVIGVAGIHRTVNLYHPVGEFKRVLIDGLPAGRHELRVAGSRNSDPRGCGNQVIFHQAISYGRDTGIRAETFPSGQRRILRSPQECQELRQRVFARQWFHTLDLGDGIVTPGCDPSSEKVGYLGLPERLDGLSVLDIGAYDGFFSFECERRGAARVVAADYYCWTYGGMATKEGFDIAKAALGSRVEEKRIPVDELSPLTGMFDLVLFLGVLYHAPDMIRYLRAVRSVCRHQMILETEVDALDYLRPAAVFYPGASLNNDASNFWGPNPACVEAMLDEVGFRKIERVCVFNMVRRGDRPFHRAVYHAFV